MINEAQAIKLATAALVGTGRQAADYEVSVEPDELAAGGWVVWFEHKGPFRIPGGRHHVVVDGHTGRTVFAAGQ